MRRHLIGVIGLLLIFGAIWFWIWPPDTTWASQTEAACWRLGAVLIVLWGAFDELRRVPGWLLATILVVFIVVAIKPRLFLLLVPLIVALAILRPRFGKKPRA